MKTTTAIRVAVTLLLGAGAGCGSASPSTDAARPAAPRAAKRPSDRAYPQILSVSPETVDVNDGVIGRGQHYEIEYSVENAARLTALEFRVYAPHIGVVHKTELELPGDDSPQRMSFWLDAGSADLGPAVRLRLQCPSGDTNWESIGADPAARQSQDAPTPHLSAVATDNVQTSNGVMTLRLYGRGIGNDCTPEARVNGDAVDVVRNYFHESALYVTMNAPSLANRAIASRFLEFQLIGHSKGYPVENAAHVAFVE